jgi:ABC-type glycerol-3-phosphate transport system substrate-binding protein
MKLLKRMNKIPSHRGSENLFKLIITRFISILFVLSILSYLFIIPTQSKPVFTISSHPKPLGAYPQQWGYQAPEPQYAQVLAGYQGRGYSPTSGIQVGLGGGDYSDAKGAIQVVGELEGKTGKILVWEEGDGTGWVEWTFEIPETGLYTIGIEYYPIQGKRASIQRDIQIDGAYPFIEARRLAFDRTWVDAHGVNQDNQGNDIRPSQVEAPVWRTQLFVDAQAMYRAPYLFYLGEGSHVIRLGVIREPIAIAKISILSPPTIPTYDQVLSEYSQKGYQPTSGVMVTVEGEEAVYKSTPTLTRNYSPNPSANPQAEGNFRLNVFGGWRWRRPSEWATWRITIPEDGLYKIGIKRWHGDWSKMPAFRSIKIDGEVPFDEMRDVGFPYDWYWQLDTLSDRDTGEPYLFYLTAGEHVIEMRSVVGPAAETIRIVDQITREMSELARQVILLTGSEPDPQMEWDMEREFPGLVPRLLEMAEQLEVEADRLEAIAGRKPTSADTLIEVSSQLRNMADNPNSVPNRLLQISETQSMLGYWTLELQEGEFEVDSIIVASPEMEMPPGNAGIFAQWRLTLLNFLASFRKEYTVIGNVYDPDDPEKVVLEVWMARGVEWGRIMKELIEETFTPQTGIAVNLHLVPPGSLSAGDMSVLLLAATAGKAPDVAAAVNPNLPVEFAIRNALVPVSQFEDYPETEDRFRPGALIPYTYRDEVFALPETQNFSIMFYRTDILDALSLDPPQTWDELYDMMWILQQNGMDFYYPPGPEGLTPFLFQHGGDYYTEDGYRSALDQPEALGAFREWTDIYTNYRVPMYADFFNRFKTGEMPIGIADYWTYVLLSTAARELMGRWQMAPIPGVPMPDGSINRATGGSGNAVVIFKQSEHPQEAWEFVKWWTSTEVQLRYGVELEALLGVEARWNTANVQALQSMAWPRADIDAITEQWRWFQERPVVLGGYYTPRHISNAWNKVVLQGINPREALEEAIRQINRELRKKQEEFGIFVGGVYE